MDVYHSVLNVEALVATLNQEKALVGAFSVIVKLQFSRRLISSSSAYIAHCAGVECDRSGFFTRPGVSWSWVPLLYSNCMEMDGRSQAGGAHFIIGKYFSPALEIFFLGLCWGTFISWSQHSFILLKVWRLCQLEQLTWRPPQLHLCWNLILSSAP